jgi:hypothetical protein
MLSRYIGSTSASVEQRVKWHVKTVSQVETWNSELARLVRGGFPSYKILAEVPDEMRFQAEADFTRRYRRHHRLVNILDGRKHTAESIRRIRAGQQKSKTLGFPPVRPVRADQDPGSRLLSMAYGLPAGNGDAGRLVVTPPREAARSKECLPPRGRTRRSLHPGGSCLYFT